MDPQLVIKYCPKCKSPLELRDYHRFSCVACGYVQYISPIPCNSVLILNDAGELLLEERKNEPKAGFLDLPGGFMELEENAEESAVREVKEELGLELEPGDLTYFGSNFNRYLYHGIREYLIRVTFIVHLKGSIKITPGDDARAAAFYPLDKIPWDKMAFGGVTDVINQLIQSQNEKTPGAFRVNPRSVK
jgi:ADP-ribose pyrophosphatase YjhB (NUDIX family)